MASHAGISKMSSEQRREYDLCQAAVLKKAVSNQVVEARAARLTLRPSPTTA